MARTAGSGSRWLIKKRSWAPTQSSSSAGDRPIVWSLEPERGSRCSRVTQPR